MGKVETQISPVASDGKFARFHAPANSATQIRIGQVDDCRTVHCRVSSGVFKIALTFNRLGAIGFITYNYIDFY